MIMKILNRFTLATLFENADDTMQATLLAALASGADLQSADLRYANLRYADLRYANLQSANLQGAVVNWQSHALLAQILLNHAGDDVAKRMVAGLIAVSLDWCWDKFLTIEHPSREWTLKALATAITPNDNHPTILDAYNEN